MGFTMLNLSLRCASCCLLEVSPVSLVVFAIRLALFFIVTHTRTHTKIETKVKTKHWRSASHAKQQILCQQKEYVHVLSLV